MPFLCTKHKCCLELKSPFFSFRRKTTVLAEPSDKKSGRPSQNYLIFFTKPTAKKSPILRLLG